LHPKRRLRGRIKEIPLDRKVRARLIKKMGIGDNLRKTEEKKLRQEERTEKHDLLWKTPADRMRVIGTSGRGGKKAGNPQKEGNYSKEWGLNFGVSYRIGEMFQ